MAILAFHSVDKSFSLGLNNYHPKRFENLLRSLKEHGLKFVSLREYISSPSESNIVAVTFDDGYDSVYKYAAPILEKLEIPATIFVPFGYIGQKAGWDYLSSFRSGRHMTAGQIKEISGDLIEIGSHTLYHINLRGVSERIIRLELERSQKGLEDLTGRKVAYISWPFGRYNDLTESIAAEIGYESGFSMSYIKQSQSNFTYPRHAVYATDTLFSVKNKLGSGIFGRLEKIKGYVMNSYSYGTILWNRILSQKLPGRY